MELISGGPGKQQTQEHIPILTLCTTIYRVFPLPPTACKRVAHSATATAAACCLAARFKAAKLLVFSQAGEGERERNRERGEWAKIHEGLLCLIQLQMKSVCSVNSICLVVLLTLSLRLRVRIRLQLRLRLCLPLPGYGYAAVALRVSGSAPCAEFIKA